MVADSHGWVVSNGEYWCGNGRVGSRPSRNWKPSWKKTASNPGCKMQAPHLSIGFVDFFQFSHQILPHLTNQEVNTPVPLGKKNCLFFRASRISHLLPTISIPKTPEIQELILEHEALCLGVDFEVSWLPGPQCSTLWRGILHPGIFGNWREWLSSSSRVFDDFLLEKDAFRTYAWSIHISYFQLKTWGQ